MDLSPLTKLPPELRNTIYDLASTTPGGVFIELSRDYRTDIWQWRLKPQTCHLNPLALTQVSKEVREETLGAFFAVNNVSLIVPMLSNSPSPPNPRPKPITFQIKKWLRELHPKDRAALKTIELDLGLWIPGGSRRWVTEGHLATCLKNHGIEAIVWITMFEPCLRDGRNEHPVSFKLSATDAAALRTLVSATQEEEMRRYHASRHDSYRGGLYIIKRYYERLQQLAMALEKSIEQRTASRKRKRQVIE